MSGKAQRIRRVSKRRAKKLLDRGNDVRWVESEGSYYWEVGFNPELKAWDKFYAQIEAGASKKAIGGSW